MKRGVGSLRIYSRAVPIGNVEDPIEIESVMKKLVDSGALGKPVTRRTSRNR